MNNEQRDEILINMNGKIGEIHSTVKNHTTRIETLTTKMDVFELQCRGNTIWIRALKIGLASVVAAGAGVIAWLHKQ